MIKILLLKINNWSYGLEGIRLKDEDADRAAEILSWHLISWDVDNNYAPVFDFLQEGTESYPYDLEPVDEVRTVILWETEKVNLPKEVYYCVKDSNFWDFNRWDIAHMNDYYEHFKIYDGYDF
ncbi:MAG: hypothetical protein K6E47_04095 [Lachnospiraceae bacterium]|nr:hypothetical protein [Lachnospiraceae bacterium]